MLDVQVLYSSSFVCLTHPALVSMQCTGVVSIACYFILLVGAALMRSASSGTSTAAALDACRCIATALLIPSLRSLFVNVVNQQLRYAIVFSKLMPPMGHPLLDAIREDSHYCYLVPLTIYPSCAALYMSWVSLKFFRHN